MYVRMYVCMYVGAKSTQYVHTHITANKTIGIVQVQVCVHACDMYVCACVSMCASVCMCVSVRVHEVDPNYCPPLIT